jgi:hypothetical protein
MLYNEPTLKPTRGTIVIDSNALFELTIPIPEQYKLNPNENVSVADLLFRMAQHGWFVVIPEMVAYQCAHTFRDGSSVSSIFPSKNQPRFFQFNARKFLAKVPNFAGNVKIVPPSAKDNSLSALYMRNIWRIYQSNMPKPDKRSSITSIRQSNYGRDFGEQAAIELIRLGYRCDPACFFLTNDGNARQKATRKGISVINCRDFFKVVETENLLGILNLQGLSFEGYFNCVVTPGHQHNGDRLDLPRDTIRACNWSSAGRAFAEAMRGIGDEIRAVNQPAPPETLTEEQPTRSGLGTFAGRYGGATFARRPSPSGS